MEYRTSMRVVIVSWLVCTAVAACDSYVVPPVIIERDGGPGAAPSTSAPTPTPEASAPLAEAGTPDTGLDAAHDATAEAAPETGPVACKLLGTELDFENGRDPRSAGWTRSDTLELSNAGLQAEGRSPAARAECIDQEGIDLEQGVRLVYRIAVPRKPDCCNAIAMLTLTAGNSELNVTIGAQNFRIGGGGADLGAAIGPVEGDRLVLALRVGSAGAVKYCAGTATGDLAAAALCADADSIDLNLDDAMLGNRLTGVSFGLPTNASNTRMIIEGISISALPE